jgi:hypothetical protein
MNTYKKQIKQIFEQNRIIVCPAIPNGEIILNAKGINHLIYKGNRSRRETERILTNIRLLPSAIKVLRFATFIQEESFYIQDNITYRFWTFEAVVDDRRIKVIVRQIGKGKKHFWSVIPAWRKDRYGILNAKRRLPEED